MEFGITSTSNALNCTVNVLLPVLTVLKCLLLILAIVFLRVYNGLILVFYFLQFHFCEHGFTKEMSSPSRLLYAS